MTYDDGDDSLQALRSAWQESDSAPYRLERAALERQAGSVDLHLRIGSAVGAFVCLIEIVAFGMFFVRSHDNYHRAGALMTVLGTAYL
ncbi:MAG TPA: hypothetical protein VHZ95_00080, partial [Polyangiales bacterium]|nr:hypothetical protein [Polyangiales bacterium]